MKTKAPAVFFLFAVGAAVVSEWDLACKTDGCTGTGTG
jgi:hypothetical protein